MLRAAKGKALTKITAINDPFINPEYMVSPQALSLTGAPGAVGR